MALVGGGEWGQGGREQETFPPWGPTMAQTAFLAQLSIQVWSAGSSFRAFVQG